MEPVEIRPWRKSPFTVGRQYRVLRDFVSLRDSFRAGEVLTYDSDAWSRHDKYTGYAFSQPDAEQLRVWDIREDDELDIWRELFKEISD